MDYGAKGTRVYLPSVQLERSLRYGAKSKRQEEGGLRPGRFPDYTSVVMFLEPDHRIKFGENGSWQNADLREVPAFNASSVTPECR